LADAPELDSELMYLWHWFIDMNNTERGNGAMGIERISSTAMMSWQWATGNDLELWERKAIRCMDAAWIAAQNSND
jgi:hypothetical protein